MASSYFGGERRLSGKSYRHGDLGDALTDIYADIDRAFTAAEAGINYPPVRLASVAASGLGGGGQKAVDFAVSTNDDGATVLTALANGKLVVDGIDSDSGSPLAAGDRVLIKDTHADSLMYKGIYVVTVAGTAGTKYVLTRAEDLKTQDDVKLNRIVLVTDGDTLLNSTFRMSTAPAILDTNAMAWTQVGVGTLAAGALSADAGGRALMATDYFNAATVAAKFETGSLDGTNADDMFVAGAIGEDKLTANELTGRVVANLAADAVIGGIPVVHMIAIPTGAATTPIVFTHKTRIYSGVAVKTVQVGTAGGTLAIQNGANPITTPLTWDNTTADGSTQPLGTIDDAYWDIAGGGTLNVVTDQAQSDGFLFLQGVRIA